MVREYFPTGRRRTLLIVAGVLTLVVGAVVAFLLSKPGQIMRQAGHMQYLKEHGITLSVYPDPTPDDEFWLRFFPKEGVLLPKGVYQNEGEVTGSHEFAIIRGYQHWTDVHLDIDGVSDTAVAAAVSSWQDLKYLELNGTLGNAAIPSFANHGQLFALQLNLPNCDSSVGSKIAAAPALYQVRVRPRLTDVGVVPLLQMPTLSGLYLADNPALTDAPFVAATPLPIQTLELQRTGVGDATFRAVIKWPRLYEVNLNRTAITDQAFAGISASDTATLGELFVAETLVTSAAIPGIVQFKRLNFLDLSGTQVTDENLELLNDLPNLRLLLLRNCPITDEGIRKLRSDTIEALWLDNTQITEAAFAESSERLPRMHLCEMIGCNIDVEAQERIQAAHPGLGLRTEQGVIIGQ